MKEKFCKISFTKYIFQDCKTTQKRQVANGHTRKRSTQSPRENLRNQDRKEDSKEDPITKDPREGPINEDPEEDPLNE